MYDFIVKYWLEFLFASVIAGISFLVKHLWSKLKKESKEKEALKEGIVALMHDRLYQFCQYHLHRGYITTIDLKNLEYLHTHYCALDGNGTGTNLYNRCTRLPLKEDKDEVDI